MNVSVDPDDLLGKAYDPRIARRLFAFVLPYRRRAIGALLLILVATVSDLLLPKLFSLAVDEVTLERRLSMLNLLGVAFLVTLGVRFLASWGEFFQISWLGNRIAWKQASPTWDSARSTRPRPRSHRRRRTSAASAGAPCSDSSRSTSRSWTSYAGPSRKPRAS